MMVQPSPETLKMGRRMGLGPIKCQTEASSAGWWTKGASMGRESSWRRTGRRYRAIGRAEFSRGAWPLLTLPAWRQKPYLGPDLDKTRRRSWRITKATMTEDTSISFWALWCTDSTWTGLVFTQKRTSSKSNKDWLIWELEESSTSSSLEKLYFPHLTLFAGTRWLALRRIKSLRTWLSSAQESNLLTKAIWLRERMLSVKRLLKAETPRALNA